jgi:hypothetical protein
MYCLLHEALSGLLRCGNLLLHDPELLVHASQCLYTRL